MSVALRGPARGLQARRYRPFGAGVRNCLGQQLAHVNIPTAIAMLVGNFRMQLSEEVGDRLACSLCSLCAAARSLLHLHPRAACLTTCSRIAQDAKADINDLGVSKGTLQPKSGIHMYCAPR